MRTYVIDAKWAALGLALFLIGCAALTPRTPGKAPTQATAFTLPNQQGNPVTLAQLTANGPGVLVFYRGDW